MGPLPGNVGVKRGRDPNYVVLTPPAKKMKTTNDRVAEVANHNIAAYLMPNH